MYSKVPNTMGNLTTSQLRCLVPSALRVGQCFNSRTMSHSFLMPNPSVKRDWPSAALVESCGSLIIYLRLLGSLRPAPYLQR